MAVDGLDLPNTNLRAGGGIATVDRELPDAPVARDRLPQPQMLYEAHGQGGPSRQQVRNGRLQSSEKERVGRDSNPQSSHEQLIYNQRRYRLRVTHPEVEKRAVRLRSRGPTGTPGGIFGGQHGERPARPTRCIHRESPNVGMSISHGRSVMRGAPQPVGGLRSHPYVVVRRRRCVKDFLPARARSQLEVPLDLDRSRPGSFGVRPPGCDARLRGRRPTRRGRRRRGRRRRTA